MTTRRENMLHEMGLGPIWKLRTPPDTGAVSAIVARVQPEIAPNEQLHDAEPDAADLAMEYASAFEGQEESLVDPDFDEPSVVAPANDVRRDTIMRMDWPQLREAVADCTACALCKSRRNTVFGVGNQSAQWMIIGEAPGAEEDARGDPFVGQAGQLLDAMLAAIGLKRERDVFIANVLKCRPPGNRNPEPEEVARCLPHLLRQVALVKPQLILLMGRFAAHSMLETEASIASLRGKMHQFAGTPAIVTYHPAYLLRTPLDKAKSWEDLVFARATWRGLQSTAVSPTSPA
jgi:DNA polymerase